MHLQRDILLKSSINDLSISSLLLSGGEVLMVNGTVKGRGVVGNIWASNIFFDVTPEELCEKVIKNFLWHARKFYISQLIVIINYFHVLIFRLKYFICA